MKKRMKIKDTITSADRRKLIYENRPCGVFDGLLNYEDGFSVDIGQELSTEYYLNRSSNKLVSNIFYNVMETPIFKLKFPDVFNYQATEDYSQFNGIVCQYYGDKTKPYSVFRIADGLLHERDAYDLVMTNIVKLSEFEDSANIYFYVEEEFWTTKPTQLLEYLLSVRGVDDDKIETLYEYIQSIYANPLSIQGSLPEIGSFYITNKIIRDNILRPKFLEKWKRIYKALIEEQYNPLKDYDITETKVGTNTNTITYGSNVETDGNVATKETTTRSVESADDIYGFNSTAPVGDSTSNTTENETIVGNADDNTTHTNQSKTGSDTKELSINDTNTISGRKVSGADLIEKELNLRNKQIFFDIIYKDIDSVLTLQIYE